MKQGERIIGGYISYTGRELAYASIFGMCKSTAAVERVRAKKEKGVRCPGCGGKIKIEPCILCAAMDR